jgi:hypothetical protein
MPNVPLKSPKSYVKTITETSYSRKDNLWANFNTNHSNFSYGILVKSPKKVLSATPNKKRPKTPKESNLASSQHLYNKNLVREYLGSSVLVPSNGRNSAHKKSEKEELFANRRCKTYANAYFFPATTTNANAVGGPGNLNLTGERMLGNRPGSLSVKNSNLASPTALRIENRKLSNNQTRSPKTTTSQRQKTSLLDFKKSLNLTNLAPSKIDEPPQMGQGQKTYDEILYQKFSSGKTIKKTLFSPKNQPKLQDEESLGENLLGYDFKRKKSRIYKGHSMQLSPKCTEISKDHELRPTVNGGHEKKLKEFLNVNKSIDKTIANARLIE